MEIQLRIDAPCTGAENMEIDEQLLERASEVSHIQIRLYRWSEPTLSLGHFQSIDDLARDPNVIASGRLEELAGLPRVRRRTGGGAILHDLEWTYSVVMPIRRSDARGGMQGMDKGHHEQLYRAIHESVRDGLREFGWDAALSEQCTCSTAKTLPVATKDPFLCFQRRTPIDLVVGAHKVLGSAQRRSRSGLLQHGSLLLAASKSFPAILGLEDLVGGNFFSGSSVANRIAGSERSVFEEGVAEAVRAVEAGSEACRPAGDSVGGWGRWLADRVRSGVMAVVSNAMLDGASERIGN